MADPNAKSDDLGRVRRCIQESDDALLAQALQQEATDAVMAQALYEQEQAAVAQQARLQQSQWEREDAPGPARARATPSARKGTIWESLKEATSKFSVVPGLDWGWGLWGLPDRAPPPNRDGRVSADRSRLLLRLKFYGLREYAVVGDGNCQFRALAHQLCGVEERHAPIRELVAAQLKAGRPAYAEFVGSQDYDAYVSQMSRDGTWGDHVTLQAAVDALNVEVAMVTSFADNQSVVSVQPTAWAKKGVPEGEGRRTLWLSFWAEVHYGSIDIADPQPEA